MRAGAAAFTAGLAVLALLAGTGLAAATAPTVAVAPDSGLTDGQIVAIHVGGLPPEQTIQVEECAGTAAAPPPDNTACDGLTLDTQAGTDAHGDYVNAPGDGNGDTGFRVYTRPSRLLDAPTTITCDAGHPCVIYVGVDQNDFSKPHTFADVRFAPGVVAPAVSHPTADVTAVAPPVGPTPTGAAPGAAGNAAAVALSGPGPAADPTPRTTGAPALAFTGASPLVPDLTGLGLAVVGIASLARRRVLQGARP